VLLRADDPLLREQRLQALFHQLFPDETRAVALVLRRIKVLLQMQSPTNPMYTNMMDAARKTMKAEGVAGLYKGVAAPLVGMGIFNAVQFASFTAFRNLWTSQGKHDTMGRVTAAAICTGVVVAFIEGPQDLIKSQMQKQIAGAKAAEMAGKPVPKAEYSSTMDCLKQVMARQGPTGMLQGIAPTVVRNMIGVGSYFAVYEWTRRKLTNNYERQPSTAEVLFAGGVGGFAYWVLCYPVDVVKTRIQTDALDPAKRKYGSALAAAKDVWNKQGAKGFIVGMEPALARSVPANAVGFLLYELTRDALTGRK
jgi:solute carrier family 25 carnitine/acylcarnitine transporter 20/29